MIFIQLGLRHSKSYSRKSHLLEKPCFTVSKLLISNSVRIGILEIL